MYIYKKMIKTVFLANLFCLFFNLNLFLLFFFLQMKWEVMQYF